MSTKRTLCSNIILVILCFKCTFSYGIETQIPKPDTVLIPVPFDKLNNIQWASDSDHMVSTCGVYKAYKGTTENMVGRWFTVYISNIRDETNYCSHFTHVQQPCGCLGIDFTIELGQGLISFVMFSTNLRDKTVTYGIATASLIGYYQLNMNKIVLRSISVQSDKKMIGNGGFIIPHGVVVDTDNFKTYMIILFCKEGGIKPIVIVLLKTHSISEIIRTNIFNYLKNNKLMDDLIYLDHNKCEYASKIT